MLRQYVQTFGSRNERMLDPVFIFRSVVFTSLSSSRPTHSTVEALIRVSVKILLQCRVLVHQMHEAHGLTWESLFS